MTFNAQRLYNGGPIVEVLAEIYNLWMVIFKHNASRIQILFKGMKKHLHFHTTFEESFVMQILEMIHTRLLRESFTNLFYFAF